MLLWFIIFFYWLCYWINTCLHIMVIKRNTGECTINGIPVWPEHSYSILRMTRELKTQEKLLTETTRYIMGSIVCQNCGVTIYITKTNAKKKKYPVLCVHCGENPMENKRKGFKEKVTEEVEKKQFKGDGVEVKKDYGAAFRKK